MTKTRILIVAGEPSGDLHASNLVDNLKLLKPGLRFFGIGGSLMKRSGVDIVFDISKLALVGVVEVLKNISVVEKAYRTLLGRIDLEKPDIAILVDYPGFNLRLASELKKRSIPVIYYISPQIWAWGAGRINTIKRCVAKIIVFFKFEEELYKASGVDAEFVGHPLIDTVKVTLPKDETLKAYDMTKGRPVIALLPGSRPSEVNSLLPAMLSGAAIIDKRLRGAQFVIAKYAGLPRELYEDAVKKSGLDVRIAEGDTYNILAAADLAVVASGTATLETAIIGTPLIIVYKANLITYILYHMVSTTRFLGLVNIIAGRQIAPELLQYRMTPENIAENAARILEDKPLADRMRKELEAVKTSLGSSGAAKRAALSILPFLQ